VARQAHGNLVGAPPQLVPRTKILEMSAISRSPFSIWRPKPIQEILFVGVAYLIYSQVRGLAGDRVVDAFGNGQRVVQLERDLGIFQELALQGYVMSHNFLIDLFNLVYFYGFFPLLIPTAIWLYLRRPHVYVLARNAFLLSGAIAVTLYLLVPTAPPRLMDLGFVDTLGRTLTPSYSSMPGVNHYAAVPSMHVGWSFLIAMSLYLALQGSPLRFLPFLLPAAMFTATVVTGNHYFIDGALGICVASCGLGMSVAIHRHGTRKGLLPPVEMPEPGTIVESEQVPTT
jgi:hypothetical protein